MYQQNKSSEYKVKFNSFLEASKLAYANKTKDSITSQKLSSQDFRQIAKSILYKGNSPLFNGLDLLASASDKAKLLAENFSLNSNLDDSGISLPVFPTKTNLKLDNISITPKIV